MMVRAERWNDDPRHDPAIGRTLPAMLVRPVQRPTEIAGNQRRARLLLRGTCVYATVREPIDGHGAANGSRRQAPDRR
jgi:hypothetical protein